ncbi:zinc finger protein, putative [Plasmodium gallinaceum]|uniref:Zinc finger protein, putative n=1 Tax=Plasmodium gallinaceum TaxID=5849 RepID=A0A1J1GNH6_PLAGA|nr:zinc finger protein, putative [Plasmodium gallinaceum]CRG93941.1 zinc finger protein, putative [Plasmodium gallinaceum]
MENIPKDIQINNTHQQGNMLDDTIEVKSMCINCEKEGINKIVKIEIPYFKNVLIHSFECEFCNYKNNVIQDLNTIKDKGIKIIFKVTKDEHLDRQLIKSEYGILKIPEIDFEIPKETQKGSINTIEGFIQTALNNLSVYLENIKSMYNEANEGNEENIHEVEKEGKEEKEKEKIDEKDIKKEKQENNVEEEKKSSNKVNKNETSNENNACKQITIENYIKMIESTIYNLSKYVISKEFPFTIEIIDPSGLSSLEYYDEDIKNNIVTIEHYERTKKELNELGFYEEDFEEKGVDGKESYMNHSENKLNEEHNIKKENFDFIKKYINNNDKNATMNYKTASDDEEKLIESFTSNCPCCNYLGSNNFCEIVIPGFKKCLILSYVCANCNFKTSEIKSSGEINPKGKKITLTVKNKSDLDRFVIKSETASIHIPIIDLTSDYGTLGGSLTTVEGLIIKIIESLEDKFKFLLGDSNIYNHKNKNENTEDIINDDDSMTKKIKDLITNLYKLCKSEELFPFDLIIDDIASNSYISSDKIDDENLKEEEYERTFEQNDMLGLTSMKTEDY